MGAADAPRRTILVVDDEPRNRGLVRGTLAGSYEILEAENGMAALESVSRHRIDLVLLDVMMPEIDGFETCRRIKAMPRDGFLPVVLATALNSQDDRNNGLAAGADEFLAKPIDRRELTLRVRGLIRIREQEELILQKEALIRKQLEEVQHLQVLKDDLFSLIVHDLRNPLAGIVGFIELLQGQLRDPSLAKARESADRAAAASGKLRRLLDEVLEVQRLEADGLPLKLEPTSLLEVARDAASTVEGAAKSRGIGIEIRAESNEVISVDRSLVRRALENLISNAIKFSPSNETVSVGIRSVQDRLVVGVADRGPGVADSVKVKLFKKFASVEARQSGDRRRGFGLGLHLVKLVATAHGGDVFVQDHVGGGTVFGVCFPSGAS